MQIYDACVCTHMYLDMDVCACLCVHLCTFIYEYICNTCNNINEKRHHGFQREQGEGIFERVWREEREEGNDKFDYNLKNKGGKPFNLTAVPA